MRALALTALLAACSKPEARPAARADAGPPSQAPSADATAVAPPASAGATAARASRAHEGGLDLIPFSTQSPIAGKSIGHTSVVFKLKLDGGVEAAFKPRSKRGKVRYRGEIAAYRLGQALGIDNVPVALPRGFLVGELRAALGDPSTGAGKLFAEEAIANEKGEVRGALIPWIHDLRFLDLEKDPKRAEWRGWLSAGGDVPADEAHLAAQISTMIVFDYLTANWDRWSGGQIGTDASGEAVFFLDNDGAFFDPPPPGPLAKQRALLEADARFSRRFIAAVRALDPVAARAAMGEDEPGVPLLSPRVLAGLEERKTIALGLVDARAAKDGEDKVLVFE